MLSMSRSISVSISPPLLPSKNPNMISISSSSEKMPLVSSFDS